MAGPGAAEPPPDLYRDTWVRYLGECSAKGRPESPGLTRCPPCAALLPSPAGGKAAGRARREQHSDRGTEASPGCCDAEPSASWPAVAPERPRRQPRDKSAPGERAEGEILKSEWIPGKEEGDCMVGPPRAQGSWAKTKGAFTFAGRSLSLSFPTCGQKSQLPTTSFSSPVRRKAAVLGARLELGFNLDGLFFFVCVCA